MSNKTKAISVALICSVAAIIAQMQQDHPELHTSKAGLEIIGDAEGCRRQPYQCPADVLTVGIGSTESAGMPIQNNKIYSDKEIADRWAKDLAVAERCVNQYANGKKQPQGAFDALTSLTFNVGCGAVKNSNLFKMAKQGYQPAMCDQLLRWVYAGGKKLPGLENRRKKERTLCLQP